MAATLYDRVFELGTVKILVSTQKQLCLIYITKIADKH